MLEPNKSQATSHTTNITDEHLAAFVELQDGAQDYALFSCFVNGTPTAALCRVRQLDDDNYGIEPVFIAITDDMVLTDHNDIEA